MLAGGKVNKRFTLHRTFHYTYCCTVHTAPDRPLHILLYSSHCTGPSTTHTAVQFDETVSAVMFVNPSVIEILSFISLSEVMALLNNTAMECAGDVTLRRVRATDVVGEMQKELHILSVCW